ncbi:MAG TPA: hypothetical protein VM452_17345 [Caulifigura sp.]|nr:hypothetical protein [Caulifigura sp.]
MYRTVFAPDFRIASSNSRTFSAIRAAFFTGSVLCSCSTTKS